MAFIAGMSLPSCVYDDGADTGESDNIRINATVIDGSRTAPAAETGNNRFTVLFWTEDQLTILKGSNSGFPLPYLSKEAPQPVEFYSQNVYDTGYPYPFTETDMLYATGYAPSTVLTSDDNFRTLIKKTDNDDPDKGRHDFLGCDLWPEVYRGSKKDPFAKDKNRLYFRHLAAKLIFYADRDRETMMNKQFVRNVKITDLEMSTDGGTTWTSMHTPSQFTWSAITDDDLTSSYSKTIEAVKKTPGNDMVKSAPQYGYHIYASETFAGKDSGFVLQRNASDRVPIDGNYVDSCYVCNPTANGTVTVGQPIRLRMDISAEMSFHPDFPESDSGQDSSTTDDLTFTRTWNEVQLTAIYQIDEKGDKVDEKVTEFKPSREYRVFIHFHRSGVNLTAMEMPWNYGGVHYITISGDDKTVVENRTNK